MDSIGGGGGGGGGRYEEEYDRRRRKIHHSSEEYVTEPLVCQHVYEKDQKRLMDKDHGNDGGVGGGPMGGREGMDKNDINPDPHADTKMEDTRDGGGGAAAVVVAVAPFSKEPTIQTESSDLALQQNPPVKAALIGPSYQEYCQKYCLTYVRTFFNKHLDDPWFRTRYSPLEYKRFLLKERVRAATEAQIMYNRVTVPLPTHNNNNNNTPQGDLSQILQNQAKAFIKGARLGGGTKPTTSSNANDALPAVRKRTYGMNGETYLANVPSTHLLSQMSNHTLVEIMDVPPHVTHDQVKLALKEHCDSGGVADIYSTSVAGVNGVCWAVSGENDKGVTGAGVNTSLGKRGKELYYRTIWVVMESETAKVGAIPESHILSCGIENLTKT